MHIYDTSRCFLTNKMHCMRKLAQGNCSKIKYHCFAEKRKSAQQQSQHTTTKYLQLMVWKEDAPSQVNYVHHNCYKRDNLRPHYLYLSKYVYLMLLSFITHMYTYTQFYLHTCIEKQRDRRASDMLVPFIKNFMFRL